MNEAQFVRRHRPDWVRLESCEARLQGKGTPLSGADLFAFVSLYRKVTGDLARARTLRLRPDLVDYLNGLVGRIHFLVYTARPYPFHRVLDFFRRGFPALVRRQARHVLASAALLLLPALAAYGASRGNPALAEAFTPPGYAELVEKSFGPSFGREDRPAGMGALATSFYIVNNVQISFIAFALGVFLGVGSAYVLAFNGAVLGGVAAVIAQHGLSYNFWSFVAPHGGIELTAIVLAGASGLRIGLPIVNPGMLTRRAALKEAARDAGLVMLGAASLLGLAAVIEAFLSPSTLPNPAKLGLGILNLAAVLAYLGLAGRERRRR